MVFYERYLQLCEQRKVAPTRAVQDIGLCKSAAQKWRLRDDSIPSYKSLLMIAKYFCISVDELLEGVAVGE